MQEERGGKTDRRARQAPRITSNQRNSAQEEESRYSQIYSLSLSYVFMRSNRDITCHVNQQLKHQIKKIKRLLVF